MNVTLLNAKLKTALENQKAKKKKFKFKGDHPDYQLPDFTPVGEINDPDNESKLERILKELEDRKSNPVSARKVPIIEPIILDDSNKNFGYNEYPNPILSSSISTSEVHK